MAAIRLGFIGFGIMGERLLRAAVAHDPAVLVPAGVWDPSPGAMANRLARIDLSARVALPPVTVACDVTLSSCDQRKWGGSNGKHCPCSASRASSSCRGVPAPTVTTSSLGA